MANTGFTLPGAAANNADAGDTAWSNPNNALADDGSNASATLTALDTSQYLHLGNFGFAIPDGATIDGAVVRVQRAEVGGFGTCRDHTVQLIVGGSRTGDNKADTGNDWPTTMTDADYGASNDGWSASLTRDAVNASNFGVALRAVQTSGFLGAAEVDAVWIDVYYTEGGGTDTPIEIDAGVSVGTVVSRSVGKGVSAGAYLSVAIVRAVGLAVGASVSAAVNVLVGFGFNVLVSIGAVAGSGVALARGFGVAVVVGVSAGCAISVGRAFNVAVQIGVAANTIVRRAISKVIAVLVRVSVSGKAGSAAPGDLQPEPTPGGGTINPVDAPPSATLQSDAGPPSVTLHDAAAPGSAALHSEAAPASQTLHPKGGQQEF